MKIFPKGFKKNKNSSFKLLLQWYNCSL